MAGGRVRDLEGVLDQMGAAAGDAPKVPLDDILAAVGRRSFGPILLVAGLVMSMPLVGDIPGVPILMGSLTALTAFQLLLHREHIWLPGWLLRRTVARDNLCKALDWLRIPARWIDPWLGERMTIMVRDTGLHLIALVCIAISLATPAMELVPFSANVAGAALTAFGLAIIAQDGLLALLGILFSVGTTSVLLSFLVL